MLIFGILILVYPCPSILDLIRAFVYWDLLARWTATVSENVSHAADGKTIRQNWLELAESVLLKPERKGAVRGHIAVH